jgi:hypothetical protein
MKRRTFLKLGPGMLAASILAACGGDGSHQGNVEPDPQAAPPRSVDAGWNEAGLGARVLAPSRDDGQGRA